MELVTVFSGMLLKCHCSYSAVSAETNDVILTGSKSQVEREGRGTKGMEKMSEVAAAHGRESKPQNSWTCRLVAHALEKILMCGVVIFFTSNV